MAIKEADLFVYDPGRLRDLSGIGPAEIFNRSIMPRTNRALEQFGDELTEPEVVPGAFDEPEMPQSGNTFLRDGMNTPFRSFAPTAEELPPTNGVPLASEEDYNSRPSAQYDDFADFMFRSEARLGSNGRLRIYEPPAGDGGGAFEIAGITSRYQPKEAARLRRLVEQGRNDEAVAAAKDFYRRRAAPFVSQTSNRGLQLQLADTVHHRGEGGLRRVLQRATGSESRKYGELIRDLESRPDALSAFHAARQDYEWEEIDRGRESRKKFRRGLQNRFNNADAAARSFSI